MTVLEARPHPNSLTKESRERSMTHHVKPDGIMMPETSFLLMPKPTNPANL